MILSRTLQRCGTTSTRIRTDNYASERYDKIKAIRARGSYLKGQENLTMKTFCYRPDQKPHRLQFHEIEKRWDEREWTVETAIHMRKAGYYVPEKIWTNMGLDIDDYGEPEHDDVPEDSAFFVAEGKDLKELRLAWNPKCEGKPKDWNDQKTWCKAAYKEAERRWKEKEVKKPKVSSFLDAFLESRMDEKGKCVRLFLRNPQEKDNGWIKYDYIPPTPYYVFFLISMMRIGKRQRLDTGVKLFMEPTLQQCIQS